MKYDRKLLGFMLYLTYAEDRAELARLRAKLAPVLAMRHPRTVATKGRAKSGSGARRARQRVAA